jgi:hypothetical protein
MLRQLWVEPNQSLASDGHFRVGVGVGGFYLDAQTWTALALGEDPRDARYEPALRSRATTARQHRRLGAVHNIVASTNRTLEARESMAEAAKEWSPAFLAIGDVRAQTATTPNRQISKRVWWHPIRDRESHRLGDGARWAATGWFVLNSLVPAA